jgi:NitT/TauT family transport system substrate-binding protein/sulfonate transport system substrate-binding protein
VRPTLPRILALLAATVAIAACGSDDDSGATAASGSPGGDVTLRIAYIGTAGTFNGPEGYAHSKGQYAGWLASAGVKDVKAVEFANGPLATQALVGGSVDVIIAGDTPQLIARSQGVPATAILQNRVGINAWLIGRKGGPTTVAGLAGKRVARQQASFQDRYLQGLLDQEGVEGVQLQAMLNPQAVAALRKGALDAAAIATVQSKALADEGFPVLDRSDDHPDLQGTSITTIRDDVAKEHPDVAQAFVDAHFRAVELAKAEEDEYYAYQATATGVPEEVVRVWDPIESYPSEPFTADGTKQLQGTLDFLVQQKLAKPFELADWGIPGT